MKKMKNKLVISIVLAVFALFAVIAVPSVSAAYPANAIYLDPADSSGLYCENNILVSGLYCKNNTLVEVRINASVTIYGVQTDIYFDPSCVNITDVDFTGSSWPGGWWHYGNYVRLIGVNSSGTPAGTPAGDNLFATVRLHCVNPDYCKSDLGFSGVVVTDEYANLIDITAYNGIFKCKLGDLNDDGNVNCDDVILCMQMVIGSIDPTDEADMNCDGTVDISDCILIYRMMGLCDLNGDGKVNCEDVILCLETNEADLNCDDIVDISDCILIMRMAGLGDLNDDDKVNCEDVILCLEMVIGHIEPTDEADLNCDGTVDISDYILIMRMAGLGDLNGDGKVTCEDAIICFNMALNSVYTDEADMNCDGTVDISDCQLIWMMVGLGDLNDDGIVDILDVILCLRQAIGLDTQTPEADMNCDSIVDMSDVVLVMHIAIGLPLDSEISVLPHSFDVTLLPDRIRTDILKIGNNGKIAPLGYCIRVDKPWLKVDPWWGLVEPGDYTAINVSINTTGLPPGDYRANINISSTDRTDLVNKPGENVPVNLTVVIQGGLAVAVLPLFSNVRAGDTVDLTVKIISTENFDDKLDVYLSTEGLDNPVDLSWFNWINMPICTDPAKQWQPDIYGDKIVYMDNRNDNWDIYMYDLSTGTETRITNDPSTQEEPSIYEDKIVWTDWREGNTDIGIYYLSTDEEILKTIDLIAQENPEIYRDNVVYESYRNGNWDIYMIELPYTCRRITSDPATQSSPAIYEDKIVYHDDRNGNWDIYLYDLSTGNEIQITTDPADQTSPDIYGDKIVYACSGSVYVYYLSTHCTEKQITHELADLGHPKIYGDKIVYQSRNHNMDIYMYDLSIDKETRITTDPAEQWLPAIYGDKIVYNDLRNSNWDIYMYDFLYMPDLVGTTIPARGEIIITLRAVIPPGESGIKMFRVIAESTIWRTEGFGTGIFGIT